MKRPSRPRDPNQLAKLIVDLAAGEAEGDKAPTPENEARSRAGSAGAKARSDTLTPERRREIARKAALARWGRSAPDPGPE